MAATAATLAALGAGGPPAARADTVSIQEFHIPGTDPMSLPDSFFTFDNITEGPDGNTWMTLLHQGSVARITPAGVITQFELPGPPGIRLPLAITPGPDGNLWVTVLAEDGTYVQRLSSAGVFLNRYDVTEYGEVVAITVGPDGALWFTDAANNVIRRITTDGVASHFPIPSANARPTGITTGPDGALWFVESGANKIGRMTTSGVVTEFDIPTPGSDALAIAAGPDGNLWFTEFSDIANKVGRITPAGVITEFSANVRPAGITAGPDGNMWYTAARSSTVGRITPAGEFTEFRTPRAGSSPVSITTSNGKLWFHELQYGDVGVLDPATIEPDPPPCMVITQDTTLQADVGPCPKDGIVVAADDVTLNLNGYRVLGTSSNDNQDDAVGIRLPERHGVTIYGGCCRRRGEVTGFDAGVVIGGGGGNVVTKLHVHDNIGPPDAFANLGDGIAVFNSSDNNITRNTVDHNGTFDGIGVLGPHSDRNLIRDNLVEDTDIVLSGGPPGQGTGIIVNNFFNVDDPARGRSTVGNEIIGNMVRNNDSSGISSISNTNTVIARNTVENNGILPDGRPGPFPGNGIAVRFGEEATPTTDVFVKDNTVRGNRASGIQVTSRGNRIVNNRSLDNAVGPNFGSPAFDLHDSNPDCDANRWLRNMWGTGLFSPECTSREGSGPSSVAAVAASLAGEPPDSQPCGSRVPCAPAPRPVRSLRP